MCVSVVACVRWHVVAWVTSREAAAAAAAVDVAGGRTHTDAGAAAAAEVATRHVRRYVG